MKIRYLIALIIFTLTYFAGIHFNVFAYEGITDNDSNIIYDSKDFNVGSNNYTLYYGENHDIIGLDSLNLGIVELMALNNILSSTNININSYALSGNKLSDYSFVTTIKDYSSNGYTFSYFLNKYAPNKADLMKSNPFTNTESEIITKSILNGIFSGFYQVDNNISTFDNLVSDLSSKLYLIIDNDSVNIEMTDSFLNNVYSIFALEFSNKVNSQLQYYYRTKESLFGSKKEYLVLDIENISASYTGQIDLINQNYNELVNIVNGFYTSEELINIDNNIFGIHTDIDNRIISAKDYAKTDYPNVFISENKTSLFSDLNIVRTEIINDLNNYKDYLIVRKNEIDSLTDSGSIDYIGGIYTDSGTLDFEYTSTGEIYDPNNVGTGVTDYSLESGEDALHNLEDFSSSDSRDIISQINNYTINLGDKVDSREDYGLALANNIEKYNTLVNFLSGSTILNNEMFLNSVNFNILLRGDIKDEFINISDLHTIRDINIQQFDDDYINANNSLFLLRNELTNYGKTMMNNQFISSSMSFPSTSKVNNDLIYKNYLKGNKGNYFDNYNKSSYTQIQERNDVEGIAGLSFSYTPSPQQIKDGLNNQIGIKLGNNSHYYLTDTNKGLEIDLDDGYDYDIKIKSYNGSTEDLILDLLDSSNIKTSLVLEGDIISKSNGKIKSRIVDSKSEDDSIHSLYVNDILSK